MMMSRSLATLLIAGTVRFAAGSPDLLVAIRNGDHAQVQILLRAGADVNTVDSDGTTALMHAVVESDANMVKLLVDSKANVNAKNALDSTALMYAATNLAKTRLLLDAGADVKVKGTRGATPMSVAATTFGSNSGSETADGQRRRARRPADGACRPKGRPRSDPVSAEYRCQPG